ncbi:MAG TPA: PAS domain-containing protein, partial [Methanocorpusculum sp.]|nr:PAS domain-containing protein [Methanocorpusculum sp.]
MTRKRISVAGMDLASCNFEESTISGVAFEYLNPEDFPEDQRNLISEVNKRAELANEKYYISQLREEMLAKGFDAGMYICRFDENENLISFEFTDGTRRMLGYDGLEDLPNEFDSWIKTLVPEEKDMLVKLFWDSVKNHHNLPDISHATYRMRKKDGSLIWVTGAGRFVRRQNGSLSVYMGCYREVTAEHEKDEYLKIIEGVGKVFNFSI